MAALSPVTTLLKVCWRREEGVVGGVPAAALRTSPHMLQWKVGIPVSVFPQSVSYLDLRLPQRLDWLPRLDMLELLLLERGDPALPRQFGTLPPC